MIIDTANGSTCCRVYHNGHENEYQKIEYSSPIRHTDSRARKSLEIPSFLTTQLLINQAQNQLLEHRTIHQGMGATTSKLPPPNVISTTSLPPRRIELHSPGGHSLILTCRNSCQTKLQVCGFSKGFPVSPRPCIPVLLHTHPASPSSALKNADSGIGYKVVKHLPVHSSDMPSITDTVTEVIKYNAKGLISADMKSSAIHNFGSSSWPKTFATDFFLLCTPKSGSRIGVDLVEELQKFYGFIRQQARFHNPLCTRASFNGLLAKLHSPVYTRDSHVCSLAADPLSSQCYCTPGSMALATCFPCKSAIGSESTRACLMHCDSIEKLNGACLKKCLPITTVGEKNNCLESTSPSDEFAKNSWLYLWSSQLRNVAGCSAFSTVKFSLMPNNNAMSLEMSVERVLKRGWGAAVAESPRDSAVAVAGRKSASQRKSRAIKRRLEASKQGTAGDVVKEAGRVRPALKGSTYLTRHG
ncbi:hypothetical protein PR048_021741 [Dryococelus australis]|uniref:Uncharacterized protein n=1 Tax=Dryococelus australis TaxID=614101 RepID=A0ABQ9GZ54_9NEOP|nr:hypothetical protein PR048_021741 [Dryococelus australis]